MKYWYIFSFTWVFLSVIGCAEDCENCDPIFLNNQREFIHLGSHQEQIFRLDSILVNGSPGDTTHKKYILKEYVGVDTSSNGQTERFPVTRFLSSDGGVNFFPVINSQYQIVGNDVNRQYGNLPFTVLNLPAILDKSWNGSVYFSSAGVVIEISGEPIALFQGDWQRTFTVSGFEEREVIGGIAYDSVITVTQGDLESLTEIRYSIEKYAWNVGLVYREMKIFDELCDQVNDLCQENKPWELRGDRGFMLRQWRIN